MVILYVELIKEGMVKIILKINSAKNVATSVLYILLTSKRISMELSCSFASLYSEYGA